MGKSFEYTAEQIQELDEREFHAVFPGQLAYGDLAAVIVDGEIRIHVVHSVEDIMGCTRVNVAYLAFDDDTTQVGPNDPAWTPVDAENVDTVVYIAF